MPFRTYKTDELNWYLQNEKMWAHVSLGKPILRRLILPESWLLHDWHLCDKRRECSHEFTGLSIIILFIECSL